MGEQGNKSAIDCPGYSYESSRSRRIISCPSVVRIVLDLSLPNPILPSSPDTRHHHHNHHFHRSPTRPTLTEPITIPKSSEPNPTTHLCMRQTQRILPAHMHMQPTLFPILQSKPPALPSISSFSSHVLFVPIPSVPLPTTHPHRLPSSAAFSPATSPPTNLERQKMSLHPLSS